MNISVSIGIFAHNEATGIADTLESLRKQTIFTHPTPPTVMVLENGSTDDTAQVARDTLQKSFSGLPVSVEILPVGDKGHTWNEFVHELSPSGAELLIFMDADIELGDEKAIESLVTGLLNQPTATITVSRPVKDIVKKETPNRLERLSISSSTATQPGPTQLCGQLYCGRAEALRQLQVPLGLLVEDGFLRAMVLTDQFSHPEVVERIIGAPGAFHYFEALTQPKELLQHERRLVIGTELNIMLFAWAENRQKNNKKISDEIARLNQAQSGWVRDMALEQCQSKTFKLHTTGYIFKPWLSWKLLPLTKKIRKFPGLVARIGFNAVAALPARSALKSGEWKW